MEVVEAFGYEVELYSGLESGRPQISKGMLSDTKSLAEKNIRALYPYVQKGYQIIGFEPSEILTLRDEYLDLFEGELHQRALKLAEQSFMLEEWVLKQGDDQIANRFDAKDEVLYVHGHCHAKALVGMKPSIPSLVMQATVVFFLLGWTVLSTICRYIKFISTNISRRINKC